MALRDILLTPGLARPAVVLAAMVAPAAVGLIARGLRAAWAGLALARMPALELRPVPIPAARQRR